MGAVRITKNVQQVNDNVRNVTLGLARDRGRGAARGAAAGVLARGFALAAAHAAGCGGRTAWGGRPVSSSRGGEGASEVEELARSFDEMADRLERTVQAQREFVANASHQLRTPLTAMKLRLEGAIDGGARRPGSASGSKRPTERSIASPDRRPPAGHGPRDRGGHDRARRPAGRDRPRASLAGTSARAAGSRRSSPAASGAGPSPGRPDGPRPDPGQPARQRDRVRARPGRPGVRAARTAACSSPCKTEGRGSRRTTLRA